MHQKHEEHKMRQIPAASLSRPLPRPLPWLPLSSPATAGLACRTALSPLLVPPPGAFQFMESRKGVKSVRQKKSGRFRKKRRQNRMALMEKAEGRAGTRGFVISVCRRHLLFHVPCGQFAYRHGCLASFIFNTSPAFFLLVQE